MTAPKSRKAPPLLDASLGFNLYRCALLFRRELVRALAHYRMTPEQWHILAFLDDAGKPVSQSDIVRALLKDKPTVTRILQRMERDGWVRRQPSSGDARVILIKGTPAGSQLCAKIPALLTRHFAKIHEEFGAASCDRLIAEMKRLRKTMGD